MIKIFKRHNKYHFEINSFSSFSHSFLTKFAEKEYRFAWEAYKDAKNIVKKYSYHIKALDKLAFEENQKPVVSDVSANTKIADHYESILDFLYDIASGLNGNAKSKYEKRIKKMHYLEIKSVIKEILFVKDNVKSDEYSEDSDKEKTMERLNKIISKFKNLVHKHYKNQLNEDIKESREKSKEVSGGGELGEMGETEQLPLSASDYLKKLIKISQIGDKIMPLKDDLLDHYGEKSCYAIEDNHPEAVWEKSKKGINIIDGDNIIVEIILDNDLLIEDIYPGSSIIDMYTYESNKFYDRYWKPIIEEIGHFCSFDDSLICLLEGKALPDKDNDLNNSFNFYDKNKNHMGKLSFKFNERTWIIKKENENNLKKESSSIKDNDIVLCINSNLPTYYQKTGRVIQVINSGYEIEYDINFGNSICRMTKKDIDAVKIN
jgi:hypothetical protein